MCFTGEMSAGFAAVGLFTAYWIHSRTSNLLLASGVFFFFTMELLQAVQYYFIASGLGSPECESIVNKVLTMLGFMHICLQPYFCHIINESLSQKPNAAKFAPEHNKKLQKYHDQYQVVRRLCLIGGFLLWLRYPMSFVPQWNTMDSSPGVSTEWLRGDKLCTFKTESMVHLGWSIPMADPSYVIQGSGIHSFLMFAPFFALYEKKGMIIQGVFLFLTGPFLASMITSNLMEQASIWCFFSIAQISIMLFLIRETLIVTWGKSGKSITSVNDSKAVEPKKSETKKANRA
jgi:hypothetical protein